MSDLHIDKSKSFNLADEEPIKLDRGFWLMVVIFGVIWFFMIVKIFPFFAEMDDRLEQILKESGGGEEYDYESEYVDEDQQEQEIKIPDLSKEDGTKKRQNPLLKVDHKNQKTTSKSQETVFPSDGVSDLALHYAVKREEYAEVQQLINQGYNVNLRTNSGRTPLHWATYNHYPKMVALLMQNGADPNIADYSGNTPLHMAILYYTQDINSQTVEELLKFKSVEVNRQNNKSERAYKMAEHYGYYTSQLPKEKAQQYKNIIRLLQRFGGKKVQENGAYPYYQKFKDYNNKRKFSDMKRILIESRDVGFNPNAYFKKRNNSNLLHFMGGFYKKRDLSEMLAKMGSNFNDQETGMLYTPVHSACYIGNIEFVKLAYEYGADFSLKTKRKRTCRDLAKKARRSNIIKFLDERNID